MTLDEALLAAVQHHQAGRFAEAEQFYRLILQHQPMHAEALHRLGLLAHQVGHHEIAVDLLRRAVQAGSSPQVWNTLGEVLRRTGRAEDAIPCYREAMRLSPGHAVIRVNLALALKAAGRLDEAAAELRLAIADQPRDAESHLALGNIHREQGRASEAIACYQRAIECDAGCAEAHSNLAVLLEERRELEAAEMHAARAVELQPGRVEFHHNLGNVRLAAGKWELAADAYRAGVAVDPRYAPARHNLGMVLAQIGRHDEAIEQLQMAVSLQPRMAAYLHSLGGACRAAGRFTQAIECYRQALAVAPDMAEAHSSLGTALEAQGRLNEAIAEMRAAVELAGDELSERAAIHSNLLMSLHYVPDHSPQALFEEHREWARRYAAVAHVPRSVHVGEPNPGRRLRIGYVSPDFREHSVAYFAESVLSHADHGQFEIYCYFGAGRQDAATRRFMQYADVWRPIRSLSDQEVADLIVADGIDILVDLSGHTAGNRLLVFARKPAPVQVTYLGYPDTTGLAEMDYRITDELCDPPGLTESLHTETLVRLPRCFVCYRPPAESPPVSQPPSLARGHITFGSFNSFAKINARVLDLWASLLLAVPGSRLMLKNGSMTDPAASESVRSHVSRLGVDPARLVLSPRTASLVDHLSAYGQVDIALDTFPYCGTTTTCEALWMGVPVVSLAGRTHVSRVGLSLLTAAGLAELAAKTEDDYAAVAASLARDVSQLGDLRQNLRERLRSSALLDASRMAADLESACRRM